MIADDALEQPADAVCLRGTIERLSEWLGQAALEGREAIRSLRTSVPMGDLAEGLRQATEGRFIQSSMRTSFSVTGPVREMHPIICDEVYRIGYEAIRNAYTHSGGSRLEIELIDAQDLTMRIKDNGVGIDKMHSRERKGRPFRVAGNARTGQS